LASRGHQCEIDIDLIAVDGDVVDQPERHDIVAEFRIFDRPEAVANGGFVHDDRYFPASKGLCSHLFASLALFEKRWTVIRTRLTGSRP